MKSLSVAGHLHALLITIVISCSQSLWAAPGSPSPFPEIPPPCDQLESAQNQSQCARFLADPDNTGGATFAEAVAVRTTDDFITEVQRDVTGGLIIVLQDHMSVQLHNPIVPTGKVALVGDPDERPRIRPETIHFSQEFVQVYRNAQGFFAWGIEWVTAPPTEAHSGIQPE
ncbi:MAG: hypothetical protein ACR2PT_18650 [Endozoicomonas sp.]